MKTFNRSWVVESCSNSLASILVLSSMRTVVFDRMFAILRDVLRLGSYPVMSVVPEVEQVFIVRLTCSTVQSVQCSNLLAVRIIVRA